MSSAKRKVIEDDSSEEESPRHHRTSLRVNLSATNFSDSGNGSLKKNEIEDNFVDNRRITRSSRIKKEFKSPYLETRIKNNVQQSNMLAVSNIQLKEVRVVLEDVSKIEKNLRKSCNELKNMILNKTEEIFHNEDEIFTKSNLILGNNLLHDKKTDLPVSHKDNVKGNQPVIVSDIMINEYTIHNSSKNPRSRKNSGTQTCNTEEQQENSETHYNITSTPKENSGNTQTDKSKRHKMRKKKLFVQAEHSDENCEKIDVDSKTKFSETLITTKENRSPILAGSYKCVKSSKVSGINSKKLLKTGKNDCYQFVTPELQHSKSTVWPTTSILQNENPIACSTMVEDAHSGPAKVCEVMPQENLNTQTIKKVLSMEMTNVRGGFIVEMTDAETDPERVDCESDEVSETTTEYSKAEKALLNSPQASKTLNTKPTKNAEDLDHRNSTETSITIESDSEDSSKAIQTSLQVNTSIDGINSVVRSRINSPMIGIKHSEGIHSISKRRHESKTQESPQDESVNTNHTSLQMNTSVNQSNRLDYEKSDSTNKSLCSKMTNECIINSTDKKNTSCEETRNLTKKLKNISIPCSVQTNTNLIKKVSTVNHATKGNQHQEIYGTQDINEKSCIEATPYPPMHSLLPKSQLKHTHVPDLEMANTSDEANKLSVFSNKLEPTSRIDDKMNNSKLRLISLNKQNNNGDNVPQRNPLHATILLDDSPLPCERLPRNSIASVIIPDSADENSAVIQTNTTINSTNPTIAPKKARKKLLPLLQSSQLVSFSPVEDQPISPKRPTFVRRRVKIMKKLGKNTCNTQNARKLTRNSKFRNDDHSHIESNFPSSTKKKKSRKVLSKKIVIKNIPDEGALAKLKGGVRLNEIEESLNSTRSPISSSDFQGTRMFHSQRYINKPDKIIIVTTGLSKEDKSLVRTVSKTLGRAKMESIVTRHTTHVVTTGVRTINLLHGIIRGCWLVSLQWVLKSLECNKWLNPEGYEMAHFSKAVMENRKDRQLFGRAYVPELFATCGLIFVESTTSPPRNALKDLIKAAGGRITEDPETAKIVIGKDGLKEAWVLDSITTGELQPCNEYQRG